MGRFHPAKKDWPVAFEVVDVGGAPVGLTSAWLTDPRCVGVVLRLEDGPIRYRLDLAGVPSTDEGIPLFDGAELPLTPTEAKTLSMVRDGPTNGWAMATYYMSP